MPNSGATVTMLPLLPSPVHGSAEVQLPACVLGTFTRGTPRATWGPRWAGAVDAGDRVGARRADSRLRAFARTTSRVRSARDHQRLSPGRGRPRRRARRAGEVPAELPTIHTRIRLSVGVDRPRKNADAWSTIFRVRGGRWDDAIARHPESAHPIRGIPRPRRGLGGVRPRITLSIGFFFAGSPSLRLAAALGMCWGQTSTCSMREPVLQPHRRPIFSSSPSKVRVRVDVNSDPPALPPVESDTSCHGIRIRGLGDEWFLGPSLTKSPIGVTAASDPLSPKCVPSPYHCVLQESRRIGRCSRILTCDRRRPFGGGTRWRRTLVATHLWSSFANKSTRPRTQHASLHFGVSPSYLSTCCELQIRGTAPTGDPAVDNGGGPNRPPLAFEAMLRRARNVRVLLLAMG